MKTNKLATRLWIVFILSALALLSRAGSLDNLETYKLNLESHIDRKIRQAVKPLLDDSQFSLNVNVIYKSPDEINRLMEQAQPPREEMRQITMVTPSQNGQEPEYTFVEVKPTDEDTLLPLSKLGLWQKKAESKKNQNTTAMAGATPLPNAAPVVAQKEIFVSYKDFVSNIAVAFYIEKGLSKEKSDSVEQVVRNITNNHFPKINLSFSAIQMLKEVTPDLKKQAEEKAREEESKKEKEKEKEKKPLTWLDLLIEFKMPIALVFCAFLLIVMVLFVTFNMNKLSQRRMEIMEKQADREDAAFKASQMKEADLQETNIADMSQEFDEKTIEQKRNVIGEKLTQFMSEDPDAMGLMIRRWLSIKNEGYKEALNFTARCLSVEKLNALLNRLTDEEKNAWNSAVTSHFKHKDEIVALVYIEGQMLLNIIQPKPSLDAELKEKINALSFAEIIQVIKTNLELGALLIVFLPAAQVAKIYELLDLDTVAKVSTAGMKINKQVIESKVPELLKVVNNVRATHPTLSPFVDKMQNLIKDVQIEKEQFLFRALSQKLSAHALLELAEMQFPSELIPQLPIDILRRAMNSIAIVKRAEILLSQKDERRDFILSLFPEGKNREILMEEIENIQMDPTRLATIERNTDKNWKLFISTVRNMIQKDESLKPILDPIVEQWIQQLVQSQGGQNARRAA